MPRPLRVRGRAIRHESRQNCNRRRIENSECLCFSSRTVFCAGHPRLNNLHYLSSLSGQRAPRLDNLVRNTPSRCGRRSSPCLLRKVRMIPQVLEVLWKLTVPVRNVGSVEKVVATPDHRVCNRGLAWSDPDATVSGEMSYELIDDRPWPPAICACNWSRLALAQRKQHIESMGLTNTHNKEQFMGK